MEKVFKLGLVYLESGNKLTNLKHKMESIPKLTLKYVVTNESLYI